MHEAETVTWNDHARRLALPGLVLAAAAAAVSIWDLDQSGALPFPRGAAEPARPATLREAPDAAADAPISRIEMAQR